MVCLTVCLSYCMIVCLFYANSAAKILLFLHICKQNPKNMQILPISALFCFILLYCGFIFHFCRIFAAVFHRLVPFFSFPALFPFSVFFRLVPFFLFLLLQANSICRSSLSIASGSDPDIFFGTFWVILDKY